MFGRRRIHISESLYSAVAKAARTRGFSSAQEYITHLLAEAVKENEANEEREAMRRQLSGLGYIGGAKERRKPET